VVIYSSSQGHYYTQKWQRHQDPGELIFFYSTPEPQGSRSIEVPGAAMPRREEMTGSTACPCSTPKGKKSVSSSTSKIRWVLLLLLFLFVLFFCFWVFKVVTGLELRAYTLSHSTSPFFVMDFFF
jgi:ABC-type uncharacterized transport system permease subunit